MFKGKNVSCMTSQVMTEIENENQNHAAAGVAIGRAAAAEAAVAAIARAHLSLFKLVFSCCSLVTRAVSRSNRSP